MLETIKRSTLRGTAARHAPVRRLWGGLSGGPLIAVLAEHLGGTGAV
ncbi:MAG TPA: hypothetical protein VGX23_34440 [Actinocrinis sp.]|nr:hypothetical protein [Actinocrinis sp.]